MYIYQGNAGSRFKHNRGNVKLQPVTDIMFQFQFFLLPI